MGFGVWGLGFGVWGLGFGVWGLGFGVWGLGFGVWGLGFGVWGLGFGVWGLGFRDPVGAPWHEGSGDEELRVQGTQRRKRIQPLKAPTPERYTPSPKP